MMENAVMVGVLLAVVGVGLFGLYYAQSGEQQSTVYVPQVTGMGTQEGNTYIDLTREGQGGMVFTNNIFEAITIDTDPINPIIFDSFGNEYGFDVYNITSAGYDDAYGGNASNNLSMCAIIQNDATAYITLSSKLNQTLPTGWNYQKITASPFNNASWPTGTTSSYTDALKNGSFDSANALTLTGAYQDFVLNWSDGSGRAGAYPPSVSIACEWSLNPYTAATGQVTVYSAYQIAVTPQS